ncbi:MAG: DUF2075 domain-containing protein, partial [Planctomycetota bacterium]|nr:DUF2075 domain-containing protein [Planctomycetota bacterium]
MPVTRAYYGSSVATFLNTSDEHVLGVLTSHHSHDLDPKQRDAWQAQIGHLKRVLAEWEREHVYFEFSIPRMGKRADVVILLSGVIVVLEYKVHATGYSGQALEQALDYALDLRNFHSGSESLPIVPVLVGTDAPSESISLDWYADGVAHPIRANYSTLSDALHRVIVGKRPPIDPQEWEASQYRPTPTIVEAARALYGDHKVRDISRSDAGAINLSRTTAELNSQIERAKREGSKVICFVTGVPGSGKTLAGLNLAIERKRVDEDEHAVFLSGNGPLVSVLREALASDEHRRVKQSGGSITKSEARRRASVFIQNIHHFRDEYLGRGEAPAERVVV